jgi:hypothetical protein
MFVAACTLGDGAHDDDVDELPSPYEDDDDVDGDAPAMSKDDVASVATDGLRTFVALQPARVVELYQAIAVHDADCPEEFEEVVEGGTTVQLWYSEGCTTAAGVSFSGGGRLETYTRSDEPGYEVTGAVVNAEGASLGVVAADGRSLQITGYFAWERGTGEDWTDASMEMFGEAIADADSAAGVPLLDGSISAQGYMYSYADGEMKQIGGEGAWAGTGLGGARAFSFAGLGVYSSGCSAEPSGTVSVRDEVGFWHDVAFDGITVDEEDEPVFDDALCDGCGSYVAAGAPDGEVCVAAGELAELLAWEEFAW